MQNIECGDALFSVLPEPTKSHGWCANQLICNSAANQDVRSAEEGCFHDVGNNQRAMANNADRGSDLLQYQCTNRSEKKARRKGALSGNPRSALGRVHQLGIIAVVAAAFVFISNPALAALGAPHSAYESGINRMSARSTLSERQGHSVLTVVMHDGSQMREFASRDGVVFAVTWHTQFKPNFAKLLGTSHPEYVSAVRSALHPGIQRHFRHEGADLVIKSNSHLNVFSGLAYRRSLLPPGITPTQLK